MSEIKTPPVVTTNENGDTFYTFGPDHTLADVARWIISEGGRDDMLYILNQMEDETDE